MTPEMMRLAQRLKLWRKRRGRMTQTELARRAGITRVLLARLETGYDPKLSTVLRLAKALRVKPGRLLD